MMQKVFQECLTLDNHAREVYGISEDVMMEHAAQSMADAIREAVLMKWPDFIKEQSCPAYPVSPAFLPPSYMKYVEKPFQTSAYPLTVMILVGPGNNGADGYVLARLLQHQFNVLLFAPFTALTEMAQLQKKRALNAGIKLIEAQEESLNRFMQQAPADIYVDALFGASQYRKMSVDLMGLLNAVNDRAGLKIACDIPTGIYENPFKADITVTMGALKEVLFLDSSKGAVGEIIVADLGISRQLYEAVDNADDKETFVGQATNSESGKKPYTNTYLLELRDLKLPLRSESDSNKGDYGFLSVIKGEQAGASILSSLAGIRFGAGIVGLVGQGDKPSEVMQMPALSPKTTAIAVGMGLGANVKHHDLARLANYPLVVDADLFYDSAFIQQLQSKQDVVFTPHPKELMILLENAGIDISPMIDSSNPTILDIQRYRFALARCFTQIYRGVLVLKGANTLIAQDGMIYISTFGTNRLAKGGSGDVLAGMIGALLAQGYAPLNAGIQAVLAHGLASQNSGIANYAFTPLDLIDGLSKLDRIVKGAL